jgi:hypothetical protein
MYNPIKSLERERECKSTKTYMIYEWKDYVHKLLNVVIGRRQAFMKTWPEFETNRFGSAALATKIIRC